MITGDTASISNFKSHNLLKKFGSAPQTAATLTFIIYMLAEHPEVMARLREEVMLKVGSSKRPSYDDLREMKYMRAVINGELGLGGLFSSTDLTFDS